MNKHEKSESQHNISTSTCPAGVGKCYAKSELHYVTLHD